MVTYGPVGVSGMRGAIGPRGMARPSAGRGFRVEAGTPDGPAAVSAVTMPSLLAAQEMGQDAVRDRDARRHGQAMLAQLTALQRALLGGAAAGTLESLAGLVRAAPVPADPRLAAVQRALLVRVAVELARGRVGAAASA